MRIFEPNARGPILVLFLVLVGPLAGCSNVDRAVATSPVPDDFHLRHPVALVDARQTLDIFLNGENGRLDDRQRRDVEAFAADYRVSGTGRIQAQLPSGAVDRRSVDDTMASIRASLARSGVKGNIEIGLYRVADPGIAAPVHLSFVKLQARLASRCGEWPEDLASASSTNGWTNRSYYNFGCASQQTLSAQIDDPRDLIRPRVEDPGDVQMRTRAIGDIRGSGNAQQGTDPSTNWSQARPITSVGGN